MDEAPTDEAPTDEATIFFKNCAMHFPFADFIMVSVLDTEAGISITEHSAPQQGAVSYGVYPTCTEARECYERQIDVMLERDYIMFYRGPRNTG